MSKSKNKIAGNKAEKNRIFTEGDHLGDWAIDFNPKTKEVESQAGKEYLVFDSKTNSFFFVKTDWTDKIYECDLVDEENELDNGGYIADLIIAQRKIVPSDV